METHGLEDGEVSVETDRHQDERRQVEPEGAEEHHDATGYVSRKPRDGQLPSDLERHDDEGYDKVSDAEVNDEQVNTRPTTPTAEHGDEDAQVTEGGDDEEQRVSDDGNEIIVRERHLSRQRRHTCPGVLTDFRCIPM